MNILHVTDCDSGGVPEVIDMILDHLSGRALFVGDVPSGFRNRDRVLASLGRKRSRNPIALRRTLALALAAAAKSDVSLIHGHSSFGGVYGALLSRILRKPFIYTPHASPAMIPNRSLFERVVAVAEILSCRQAGVVIACSDDEASVLRRYGRSDHVRVIPNGVVAPSANRVSDRPWDILFVGRISPQKRPDLFVQISEGLKSIRPASRVGWVGAGTPLETSAVEWIGPTSEESVSEFLLQTKIYTSVADYEGLSLASLRAGCAGCLLALRDTIGTRSPVTMGASGFLFSDPNEAVTKLAKYLDDDSHWTLKEVTQRRQRSELLFSVDSMIDAFRVLYAEKTVEGAAPT